MGKRYKFQRFYGKINFKGGGIMNIAKFSLHMLLKEKGKSFFYIFSCTFSVMVMFLFLNILYNTNLQETDLIYAGNFNNVFSIMLSFLVMAVIVGMSFYAYNFYLTSQTKEIGIFLLGGSGLLKIFWYLFVQNTVIFLFALVIGLVLGHVIVPVVNAFINFVVGANYPIFVYHPSAFWGTVVMVAMTLFYLAFVSTGFIHRNEIKDLMGMTREIAKKDDRIIALPSAIYIFFMVIPFYLYLTCDEPQLTAVVVFAGLLAGFNGFCKYVFPIIVEKLQRKVLIDKKFALISSAHVHHDLVQSCTSLLFFLIIALFMNTYVVSNVDNLLHMALIIVAYICLIISVIMSFYYKMMLVGGQHKQTFKHLFKMGYKKDEIRKMIKQEVVIIYFLAFLVAFVHILLFYIGCISKQMISVEWAMFNMSIFIIAIVVCGLVNYFTYKKEILKEIR